MLSIAPDAPIGWPKSAILCMISRMMLNGNQKRIKLRAVSLSQLNYVL